MNKSIALAKLAEACVAQGVVATATERDLTVDGQDLAHYVDVKEMHAKRGIFDRGPSKVLGHSVSVGAYGRRGMGERARLPQKQDGSHSWGRGAEILIRLARQRNATAARDAGIGANVATIEELREELGVKEYYGPVSIKPNSVPDKPVVFKIDLSVYVTVERARELHAALAALGLLK